MLCDDDIPNLIYRLELGKSEAPAERVIPKRSLTVFVILTHNTTKPSHG